MLLCLPSFFLFISQAGFHSWFLPSLSFLPLKRKHLANTRSQNGYHSEGKRSDHETVGLGTPWNVPDHGRWPGTLLVMENMVANMCAKWRYWKIPEQRTSLNEAWIAEPFYRRGHITRRLIKKITCPLFPERHYFLPWNLETLWLKRTHDSTKAYNLAMVSGKWEGITFNPSLPNTSMA